MTEFNGSVNSCQSLGSVDGPGIRFVVFTQGCPIRCMYCHNPETWDFLDNNTNTDELVAKILRFKSYFKDTGGVTISGGEPLCQPDFLLDLLKKLKDNGIHTCIDTSAQASLTPMTEILSLTDLVLLDIKFLSSEEYKKYVKGSFDMVLNFLELTKSLNIPLWIRHVLVPNITDNEEYVLRLQDFCSNYPNIKKIELLPFKNICKTKYENLGIEFQMDGVMPVAKELSNELKSLIKEGYR